MKKLIILLASLVIFSVVGCGEKVETVDSTKTGSASPQIQKDTQTRNDMGGAAQPATD